MKPQNFKKISDAKMQQIKLKMDSLKAKKSAQRKKYFIRFFILVAIVGFALFSRCSCQKIKSESPLVIKLPIATPTLKTQKHQNTTPTGELGTTKIDRPKLTIPTQIEPVWTQLLRAQVSARSGKLSTCFPEASKGALKWTAHISGKTGLTSQHEFEDLEGLGIITDDQKICLLKIFAEAPYSLSEFSSLETRFSLILAF